jgi:hypothetical protein
MSTLMTVGDNYGERRCDEKCYDANSPICTCICGGMNHGKGKKQAMDNTETYARELLKKIKEKNPALKTTIKNIQQSIFD